jgi:hypothetical protein
LRMLEIKPKFLAMIAQVPSWHDAAHHKVYLDGRTGMVQRKLLYSRGQACLGGGEKRQGNDRGCRAKQEVSRTEMRRESESRNCFTAFSLASHSWSPHLSAAFPQARNQCGERVDRLDRRHPIDIECAQFLDYAAFHPREEAHLDGTT